MKEKAKKKKTYDELLKENIALKKFIYNKLPDYREWLEFNFEYKKPIIINTTKKDC